MSTPPYARFMEVWNREGLEAAAELGWDPDITWIEAPDWPGRQTIHGREAMIAHMRERLELLGGVRLEFVAETRVTDEISICELIAAGKGAPSSGAPTQARQWLVVEAGSTGAARCLYEFMSREPAEAKARELATDRR